MLRLLPYRQYHDIDVINMFALEDGSVNENVTGVGSGDNGVFVKVTTGDFNADPVAYGADSYLGKTDYPHVGFNQYPKVAKKVAPAASGEAALVLGITLSQTAKYDENGEKLSYYPAKAADLHAVLPGQAVPIALAESSLSVPMLSMEASLVETMRLVLDSQSPIMVEVR